MEASDRHSYTKEQRDAVLAEVPALGVAEAARKHGVPKTTATRWAAAAGVKRESASAPASARKPKAAREATGEARPRRKAKDAQAAEASKREEPVQAPPAPKAAEPPSRRTLKARTAKLYTPSQKALILEDAAKEGVTAAAKKHGVSRFTIYDWDRKVAKAAEGEGDSPTSGPSKCEIAEQRDKEILDEWHRHPGLGPSQIKNQLRRKSIKTSFSAREN
jgi:transposase